MDQSEQGGAARTDLFLVMAQARLVLRRALRGGGNRTRSWCDLCDPCHANFRLLLRGSGGGRLPWRRRRGSALSRRHGAASL